MELFSNPVAIWRDNKLATICGTALPNIYTTQPAASRQTYFPLSHIILHTC
jgi:hypothetical protein